MANLVKLKAYKTMPTLKSSDTDWLAWMASLELKYGEADAAQLFLSLWAKRGSQAANTNTLRHTLSDKYKIQINESAWQTVVDAGAGVGRSLGGFFHMGKNVMIIGGVVVGLVALSMLVNVIRTGKPPLPRI